MKDHPFDAAQDLADAPSAQGVRQRPKDAATLILTRGGSRPEVLMGRRAPGHVFMASKWVFPGGRIDRSDFTAAATGALSSDVARRLEVELSARRARALALTAVRETFEETGLILGRPAPSASVAGPWREYRQAGALPDLSVLSYIARAITPPGRARRFDARFFMAPAEALLTPEPTAGSGELDEIAWLPLDQARALDLPAITRFVLGELAERLTQPNRPLPFVRMCTDSTGSNTGTEPMAAATITLRLTIADPVAGVAYSLQDKANTPVGPRIAGDGPISFDAPATLSDDGRLTGPFVRREGPTRRFVYIAIGTSAGQHASEWSRRAKIDVHDIPADLPAQARQGRVLEVVLPGRAKDGGPACATVRPLQSWRAV